MNMPPVLMHVKIKSINSSFGLWLPLFLLIPLALVVLIILSPLILIAIIVLWPSRWGRLALHALPVSWGVFCAMRGLKVDIHNPRESVFISVV